MTYGFKVGDRVQVVRPMGQNLPLGLVQTVYAIHSCGDYDYVYFSKEDVDASKGWDIDRFVKYEEKEVYMKINMNKKYRRVGTHEPVRVICVDRKDCEIPCVGLYLDKNNTEGVLHFDFHGVDLYGIQIVEEVPAVDWSKVEVDTPMWMRTFGEGPWHKRHFHKFEGGRVHYWPNGYTSFTCNGTNDVNSEKPENCSLEEPQ